MQRPVDYVNPFISTQGDHGHWLPAAAAPFGYIKLCPDTYPGSLTADGDFAHGGYDYSDNQIRGFSHFHRGSSGGTRIIDRSGYISILPFAGEPADTFFNCPIVGIDKSSETASAGYYSVLLPDNNILVELTATMRVGFHRYSFFGNRNTKIFLNSGRKFGNLNNKPLLIKAGFSLTGVEAAARNLEAECPGWDFEEIKKGTSDLWNEKLSKIMVEGDSDEYKTIFYTALYHTLFLPVVINDLDGSYPGLDQQLHKAQGYSYYHNYAFWDSFRTKYPLFSLYIPGNYSDIVKSLRDIYEQADNSAPFPDTDHPPHGIMFNHQGKNGYSNYTNCRQEHMLMVMTDAYYKGLFDMDLESVYPYIRREIMWQMPERYDSIGYIPARPDQTGEYSWDNWCVAQLARSIGNQIDLHAPFLFNYTDSPWKTQKWVRKILTEPIVQRYGTHNFFTEPIFGRVYKNAPDGYLEEMDDDYGCMAAWNAMSAMGIYQICPGNPVYQLTAPIFEKVTIKLDQEFYRGKEFVVKANGLSKQGIYIQSATLNGKSFNRPWLSHDEITAGGELVFEMGSEPNKNWGIAYE